MKEDIFHTLSRRLNGLLEIYLEAYPSARVQRTYENSIYQSFKSEIQGIANILLDQIDGREAQQRAEGGLSSGQALRILREQQQAQQPTISNARDYQVFVEQLAETASRDLPSIDLASIADIGLGEESDENEDGSDDE